MYLDLKNATLDDVARNYQDVIRQAKTDSDYCDELRDLFSECIGDDNLGIVLAHPDAFKAIDDNGFAAWHVFILDTESNIDKLINAGYDRSEVLSSVANDIFYGSPYADESPSHFADVLAEHGSDKIKAIVQGNHKIDESYLDEIVDGICDYCEEMLEIRSFLSGNN